MLFLGIGIVLGIIAAIAIWVWKGKFTFLSPLAALLIIAIGFTAGSVKVVPTGHTGVVTTFGRVESNTVEAGINFLKPWSKVIKMDNRNQKYTVDMSAFSSDIQEVNVTYTVNFAVDKENAQNLYRTVGLEYYNVVINPKVVENVKRVVAKYTAENLVASRAEVATTIEDALRVDLSKYNIELIDTSIENIDFTDAFTNAVEAKQVAEQNRLKAKTEAETQRIEAQAKADVNLIEAKAAAEANELLTKSLTDKILREEAINKWDGKMPIVISDGSNILDLTGLTKSE